MPFPRIGVSITMADECFVCLEDYKSKNKRNPKIVCQHCPVHACRQCHQRHLLLTFEDPHCLSCKRGWNSDFMGANFPISFRNGALRTHRRKVLVEREKTLLPAVQIYAEYKRSMQRLSAKRTELSVIFGNEYQSGDTVAFNYRTLKNKLFVLGHNIGRQKKEIKRLKEITDPIELPSVPILLKQARETRDALKKLEADIQEKVGALEPQYLTLKEEYDKVTLEFRNLINLYAGREAVSQRREFIMRCPAEGCRGFLSTAYKCGTCECWACVECHVSVGKEKECGHICDPQTVETAKAIKAETRPCPKCGTRIFKTDGCDQMWCVMEGCGAAFSWNTGHIVTGVIHNPHYYEWLRRREGGALEREAGDIPCGGMPNTWQMVGVIRELSLPEELNTAVLESFRNLQELVDHRMRDYPSRLPQLANKDDDVEYLLNEITEDVWQTRLERTETKFLKKKEIGQILQTIATAGADMMNRIYERAREVSDSYEEVEAEKFVAWILSIALPELEQLRAFGNESLLALAKRDRMAVPQFETNWSWKGLRAIYAKKATAVAPLTEIVESVES